MSCKSHAWHARDMCDTIVSCILEQGLTEVMNQVNRRQVRDTYLLIIRPFDTHLPAMPLPVKCTSQHFVLGLGKEQKKNVGKCICLQEKMCKMARSKR
jgi:hypothetical protein